MVAPIDRSMNDKEGLGSARAIQQVDLYWARMKKNENMQREKWFPTQAVQLSS